MSIEKDCLKRIFQLVRETEAQIKEHKEDKTLEHPIDGDFIKTRKAMGYERILSELRLFKKNVKSNK